MSDYQRFSLSAYSAPTGEITIVRLLDRQIKDDSILQEIEDELFSLVEKDGKQRLVLNFAAVEFLSSTMLNILIKLDNRLRELGGKLRLCNIQGENNIPFKITRLDKKFEIRTTEGEALTAF
jgi:anti-sigma B factor antagonist